MSFWHHEVEEELTSLGVRKKWTFCKEAGDLSGTFDTAMEMVVKSDVNSCTTLMTLQNWKHWLLLYVAILNGIDFKDILRPCRDFILDPSLDM